MKAENCALLEQMGGKRPRFTDAQRRRLARKAKPAVLSFEYGDIVCDFGAGKCEEGKDWFSSVEIEIRQGRAVGRTIFRAEGKGSSSFDEF